MGQLSRRQVLVGLSSAGLMTLLAGGGVARIRQASESDRLINHPFISGEGGYSCYRTPGLAVSAEGTVLAFCGGRLDNCKDEGNIDVLLRRSTDGGQSWGPLQVIANDGLNPCKIPLPVVLPSGSILLLWLWNASVQQKAERGRREVRLTCSDDDGSSWAPSRDITSQVRLPGWKPWYGIGPGHGIVKQLEPAPGRIVVPARHGLKGRGSASHLLLSDDGGASWRVGAVANYGTSNECTVAELGDGSLMLNSRSNGGRRVVSVSRDGGLTMASSGPDPQLIEPVNGCQASLLTYGFGPGQQATLLFANPVDLQHRTNGRLRLSTNNGQSWSRGYGYGQGAGSFTGYSDLARFANGDVGLLVESGASYRKARDNQRHGGIVFQRIPFELIRST